jgi:hypothetical protein
MQQQNSRSGEHEISILFQGAIKKLDKIDTAAKKEKTHVVQDLAKNLEGKIPTETIAIEIVHQLRGKVSERLVQECLDEKYKQKRRMENARKQEGKNQGEDKNLAALVPLNCSTVNQENNKVLIDTSGGLMREPDLPTSNTV